MDQDQGRACNQNDNRLAKIAKDEEPNTFRPSERPPKGKHGTSHWIKYAVLKKRKEDFINFRMQPVASQPVQGRIKCLPLRENVWEAFPIRREGGSLAGWTGSEGAP